MSNSDLLYKIVSSLGFFFSYECIGLSHIRARNPAIFVSNHLGSIAPVQIVLSLPVRLYPWVIAEMTDLRRAPLYLYDDFIHPAWRLEGRFGHFVSKLVSQVAVRLLNGLGSVPIDQRRGVYMGAYHRSLELLRQGKNLLIFPEDSQAPLDSETQMRPFMRGFVLLSPMYYRLTGRQLPFYPVAVSSQSKKVAIDRPLYYDLRHGQDREAITRFCELLQARIKAMYLILQRARVIEVDDIPILFAQETPDEEDLLEVEVGNR